MDSKQGSRYARWVRSLSPGVWVAFVIAVIAVVFILQNRQESSIQLFTISITAPLWTILLATLIVGFLIGLLTRRRRRAGKS